MKTLLIVLAVTAGTDWMTSLTVLTGASCIEDLEEETVEHFRDLADKPLDINSASYSKLVSSGLLSSWQAVSLYDWRQQSGPVGSFTELSLINGFSPEYAEALKPFITMGDTQSSDGRMDISADISARFGTDGLKAKIQAGMNDRLAINAAGGSTFSTNWNKGRFSLYAGDLHARFGQGLALWTSMTMTGAGNAMFARNPGGLREGTGYSRGTRIRGAGVSWSSIRADATLLLGDARTLAANANARWKNGQTGLTFVHSDGTDILSADFKQNTGGMDLYGEFALDLKNRTGAGLAGATWSPRYRERFSALARLYPTGYSAPRASAFRSSTKTSDEAGLTLAADYNALTVTADLSKRISTGASHFKTSAQYRNEFRIGKITATPEFKVSGRLRPAEKPAFKTDIRSELVLTAGRFSIAGRYETVIYNDFAWLWYVEPSYTGERFSAWLRGGIFRIDDWDDRIYVWQRDLSGTFNVPAFYRRGWNLSLFLKYRKALALRASFIRYPLEPERDKLELRLQYVKHFFHSYTSGPLHKNKGIRNRM